MQGVLVSDPLLNALAVHLEGQAPDVRDWPRLKRHAAIALVLRPAAEGPEVLVMRRVEREGDRWSGDVACPGGFGRRGEAPLDTAIRETREELGLDLTDAPLLGRLRARPTSPWHRFADFQVAPFVFAVPPECGALTLEVSEVASAKWIPVHAASRGAAREHFWWWWRATPWIRIPFRVPRVWVDDYDVWGMTLEILQELAGRLDRVSLREARR